MNNKIVMQSEIYFERKNLRADKRAQSRKWLCDNGHWFILAPLIAIMAGLFLYMLCQLIVVVGSHRNPTFGRRVDQRVQQLQVELAEFDRRVRVLEMSEFRRSLQQHNKPQVEQPRKSYLLDDWIIVTNVLSK